MGASYHSNDSSTAPDDSRSDGDGLTTDDPVTRWEARDAVLQVLSRQPRMHVTTLASAVGADSVVVDQACFDLQRDGFIRARGGGDFSITALGENRVRNRTDH